MDQNDRALDLPVTMPQLLAAQAALGDQPLLVTDREALTYGEADRRSRRIADGFMRAGAARGSRVALLCGNRPSFVLAFLAVTRIGGVALPLSTMSTEDELKDLLDSSDAEFLIADPDYRGRDLSAVVRAVTGAPPGEPVSDLDLPVLRRIWIGTDELEAAGADDAARVEVAERQVVAADVMALVHTSGSTSRPKGVIHTHGAVLRNMRGLNAVRRLGGEDRLFSNSPFFWVGGLAFSLLATLIAGARLICSSANAAETLDLLERERPNLANGFASTVLNLARDPSFPQRDLSFLKRGNLYPILPPEARPADPELRHNLLGMTETGSVCLIGDSEDDQPESRRGSFGRPVPGMETRVVDPETGEDAPEGELWLRGPAVMQGYYGQERHETFTADGWYRSGDMVRVDQDGFHYFLGRRGDIIKTAGANVSPREVEAVLSELCPGRLSIVFGAPDEERGEVVAAVVVGDEPVDAASLQQALARRLSRYKVPRLITSLREDQLPRLSSGKPDMKTLMEMVRAQ